MRKLLALISLVAIACNSSRHGSKTSVYQPEVDAVIGSIVPDKRTMLLNARFHGTVLKGETNDHQAKASLLQQINAKGINYIDSITVLPAAELQGKVYGVITLSVANLRTEPSHRAELASQATMGTPVRIWKRERGFYLVQTPDNYLAYIDGTGVERMDSATFVSWKRQPKIIFTQPYGFAYAATSGEETISDLVYGDVMPVIADHGNYIETLLPAGRKAFIQKSQVMAYAEWRSGRQPQPGNLIAAAKKMMGVPYLWGGTSFKGVDCSGFTKTVFFMNGLVLPRDASQQVHVGEEIDTANNWQSLQPGDLLFFGSRAREGRAENVSHVGIWIGNGEFIHAAGMVRINSLDPSAPHYDASEHRRFLRAKRITPKASLYDLRVDELY